MCKCRRKERSSRNPTKATKGNVMTILWATVLAAAPAVGHAAGGEEATLFNIVSLQANASREVPNDQMRAILSIEAENSDQAALAREINDAMEKGMAIAKQQPAVRVKSGIYQTNPVYRFSTIDHWRARQDLEIESGDVQAMTRTIGNLQSLLRLTSLGFTVTPDVRRKAENELITEGLQAFGQRADLVRSALGAKSYRIKDLAVEADQVMAPQPYMALAVAKSSPAVPAPVVEAGTTRVQIRISGSIQLLQPKPAE